MKTSSTGRNLIEKYEGCILSAYDDYNDHVVKSGDTIRGTLTIGFGHTSAAGLPRVYVGQKISKEQADEILGHDLASVENDVARLVKVPLNQNQFDALVSFQFNTGALAKSSILTYLNKGDYKTAAERILLYTKANGKTLSGLQRRRAEEKKLFETKPSIAGDVVGKALPPIIATGALAWYMNPHIWLEIGISVGIVTAIVAVGIYLYKHRKTK